MSKLHNLILRTLYDYCKENDFKHPHMIIAKNLLEEKKADLTIENIKLFIYNYFNISEETGDSKTRKREIVQARQIAMTLAKEYSDIYRKNWSLAEIGWIIGKKDHATVFHAQKTVKNLCDTDRKFNKTVVILRDKIRLQLKPK